MQRTVVAGLFLLLGLLVFLTPSMADDDARHDPLRAKYPDGLPKYLTDEERLLPLPQPEPRDGEGRAPPTGVVRCPAEYEPCAGLFMSWEGYTDILTQMTVGVTANDPTAKVWMVVDTTSEQTSVYNSLNAAGAVMSSVEFIVRTTDTVWIRDYGPRFIFEDGLRAIIDHTYNRPRPNDNLLNDYVAALWGVNQYDIPLTHGGGNFHLFSNGEAFMSSLILTENPGLTAQQVKDYYLAYQNLDLTIYTGFPTSFDSTQHIDMWMFPLGDNKVLIGQYASSTGQPYTITENAVADLTSRGYTVYRTPGWNSGGTHYTYTNAVIINNRVFISRFNVSQDAQALATFQAALPGYTIQQIDSTGIIGAAGAMHCIVMHVPAYVNPIPTVTLQAPNGGEQWGIGESRNITWSASDDVAVTGIDLYYSTDGGASYPYVIALGEPNDGVFPWTVPNAPTTQCRVKVVAHDGDGHSAEDESAADFSIIRPLEVFQSFPMDVNPGWTVQGQWAFGQPTGGGTHNRDPNSGYTGLNVYGYNLNGDYPNNMAGPLYLTTTAIDCTNAADTQLRFRRWLGVEGSSFDGANIQASNDGVNWTTIWQNGPTAINEAAWSLQTYSLAAVADGQPTVYVRWGMGPTDATNTYPGWNIDDVEFLARDTSLCWGVSFLAGDVNGDSVVDGLDVRMFVDIALNPAGGWTAPQLCAADFTGEGTVDTADVDGLLTALLTAP